MNIHNTPSQSFLSFLCLICSLASHFIYTQYWLILRPIFFAPFLTQSFYHYTREQILVFAFFLGLFSDCSSSYFFGIHTFLYVIVSFLLYKANLLFKEHWLVLTLLNVIFSIAFVLLSYPILSLFHYNLSWNASSLLLDIKHIMYVDGLYSGAMYLMFYCIIPGLIKIKNYLRRSSCY